MSAPDQWSRAFARQANADARTWDRIQRDDTIPECHKLLFLQMACEKLVKAHLCQAGSKPADLQKSHAYVNKNLPIILSQELAASRFRPEAVRLTERHIKHLSQEIELLAPAVKRGGRRRDNCEYPWEDAAGSIHVPLDWTFVPSQLVAVPAGLLFLKLVRQAIARRLGST
jgi:hypothetical protein